MNLHKNLQSYTFPNFSPLCLRGVCKFYAEKYPACPLGQAGVFQFSVLLTVLGLHAALVVQDGLADTEVLGGDLQQLVIRQELQTLLQAHLPGRHQTQSVVAAGGTGIGQLLLLADVHHDVLLLGADAHHHALVHAHVGADKQHAALLSVEQAVGDGFAGLAGHQRAGIAAAQLALEGRVAVKHAGHDTLAAGIGQELVAIAEQAAAGHQELHLHAIADGGHLRQVGLAGAQLLDDGAHALAGHVHHQTLDGLALLAVDGLVQHAGRRHLELVALAAHGLDQNGTRPSASRGTGGHGAGGR